MRLVGLVVIFFVIGTTAMGLADSAARKGIDQRLAEIGIAIICSGMVLVRIGSRKRDRTGFQVKLLKDSELKEGEREDE